MSKSTFSIFNQGRRAVAGLTLSSFMFLAVPVAAVPSGVGVEESNGAVSVRAETGLQELQAGSLEVGQSIVVGEDAGLNLVFPNGNRVRVAPNSEFRINLDGAGQPELYLLTGRVITNVKSKMNIRTFRTDAVAANGEFVLSTNSSNTELNVISGDAKLNPTQGQLKRYGLLESAGLKEQALLAFGRLTSQQSVGEDEPTFGAQGKGGKGKTEGIRNERERVTGGVGRVAPDQDMLNPGEDEAAIPPEQPPVTTTNPPPAQPPTTTTPPPAAAGTPIWPILLGIGGIAGLVVALAGGGDDDDVVFGGGIGPNVPSPSLP